MQIKVVDWMKGKTCGLCGKADGETMQEYRTPTGWIATTAVSFAHSWTLPAENCRDATGKTKISDVIMASLLNKNILNLSGTLKSLLLQSAVWGMNQCSWRSRETCKLRTPSATLSTLYCAACLGASLCAPPASLLASTAFQLVSLQRLKMQHRGEKHGVSNYFFSLHVRRFQPLQRV